MQIYIKGTPVYVLELSQEELLCLRGILRNIGGSGSMRRVLDDMEGDMANAEWPLPAPVSGITMRLTDSHEIPSLDTDE